MGTYRLLLAICVLLSHLGIVIKGHDSGVSAVVSFFLLSGFVMTALIRQKYSATNRIGAFYLDRAMRLFPQFLLYMALTAALIAIAHPNSPFLTDLTPVKEILNFLMLPLVFFMQIGNAVLIPQAWSLGLELTFYIAIPFLLIYRLERVAFAGSVAIFLLAYFRIINTDVFGYRLLPGTLFIFLCGSFLYRLKSAKRIAALVATYTAAAALFIAVRKTPFLQVPDNFDVLVGFLIGLPAIALLSRMKLGALDEMLGNVSYGVFLNHFLLIWLFQVIGISMSSTRNVAILIACSFALGWASYMFVERPILKYRRRLRSGLIAKETGNTSSINPA